MQARLRMDKEGMEDSSLLESGHRHRDSPIAIEITGHEPQTFGPHASWKSSPDGSLGLCESWAWMEVFPWQK